MPERLMKRNLRRSNKEHWSAEQRQEPNRRLTVRLTRDGFAVRSGVTCGHVSRKGRNE
jgi:hypothetical protein